MTQQKTPKTMIEAVRRFADPQVAHDFFVQRRWPNGAACPIEGCGSMAVAYMPKRRRFYCNDCKGQFTAKVGTIFEDSPIGFDKWLPAFWLLASNRNGISSHELSRALEVTQKTAWFMLHRIREAMADKSFTKLRGPVEVDETFVGPRVRAIRRPDGSLKRPAPNQDKVTIMGIVERKGKAKAFVVPSKRRETLADHLRAWIECDSVVYTDAAASYKGINDKYIHHVINHAIEYVNGHIHTNNVEGFWSVFKRTIRGTYVAPRPEHLQRYVEEQVFRFNQRHAQDGARFAVAARMADGKRLTYKALTSKS